jgi:hypothetical protein
MTDWNATLLPTGPPLNFSELLHDNQGGFLFHYNFEW